VLVAPVAWSQHLILVLVPLAVAGTAAVRSNAYSLVAWALTAIVISAPDPPVALLSTAIWPGASAAWPIVTPALILLWALALARPSSSAIVHEPAAS
jgi:hypothetical protein